MELTGALSNPLESLRLVQLAGRLRPRSDASARSAGYDETAAGVWRPGKSLPSRPGAVLAAVAGVLEGGGRPMSVAEIHAAVTRVAGAVARPAGDVAAVDPHWLGIVPEGTLGQSRDKMKGRVLSAREASPAAHPNGDR